ILSSTQLNSKYSTIQRRRGMGDSTTTIVKPSFFTGDDGQHFTSRSDDSTTTITNTEDVLKNDVIAFNRYFKIQESVETIDRFTFKRVALQMPDTMLWASSTISSRLKSMTKESCDVFILGDTAYGSCCVDEVTASHLSADFIIHYGHSCLSPATKLPVQYVFGSDQLDTSQLLSSIQSTFTDTQEKIIIFYQLEYQYKADELESILLPVYPNIIITKIDNYNNILSNQQPTKISTSTPSSSSSRSCCGDTKQSTSTTSCCNDEKKSTSSSCCNDEKQSSSCCSINNNNIIDTTTTTTIITDKSLIFGRRLKEGFKLEEEIENYKILWIGKDCITLTNLLLNFNKNTFYRCNVDNQESYKINQESLPRNQGLMKRYYISQKCKEANIIGIVVATLTVQKYGETIDKLKQLILNSGKKPYVFVVGRLNVPKLANFSEIDMFVIVACAENTIIDSKEYYKPIATPWEVNLALGNTDWTGEYITDFSRLFPRLNDSVGLTEEQQEENKKDDEISDEEGNKYHYSFTSGKLVKYGSSKKKSATSSTSGEIVSLDDKVKQLSIGSGGVLTTAADVYQTRTYKGLQTKIGETEVTKAVQGQSGIPKQYSTDHI
ncbi:diphthamide biosynthesis protein 2, partial [Cavenderia fasciculata]